MFHPRNVRRCALLFPLLALLLPPLIARRRLVPVGVGGGLEASELDSGGDLPCILACGARAGTVAPSRHQGHRTAQTCRSDAACSPAGLAAIGQRPGAATAALPAQCCPGRSTWSALQRPCHRPARKAPGRGQRRAQRIVCASLQHLRGRCAHVAALRQRCCHRGAQSSCHGLRSGWLSSCFLAILGHLIGQLEARQQWDGEQPCGRWLGGPGTVQSTLVYRHTHAPVHPHPAQPPRLQSTAAAAAACVALFLQLAQQAAPELLLPRELAAQMAHLMRAFAGPGGIAWAARSGACMHGGAAGKSLACGVRSMQCTAGGRRTVASSAAFSASSCCWSWAASRSCACKGMGGKCSSHV